MEWRSVIIHWNYVSRTWPSSLHMNALNVGHGVYASSWPVISKHLLGKFSLGASKFISLL